MNRRRGKKIGGIARIRFNRIRRCAIPLLRNDNLPGIARERVADQFGRHAELVHEPHSHGDVGPARLRAVEINSHFMPGIRRDL